MTIDDRISAELRRHAPEVDEHAAWDRIRSQSPVHRRSRAIRVVATPVAAASLLVVGYLLLSTLFSPPDPAGDPQSPVLGMWLSIDGDLSTQTMVIDVSTDGVVEIVVVDDDDFDAFAVCSGASSTIKATGRFEGANVMVFPSPVLTCDSGRQPETSSGPPLGEQLRILIVTHHPESDILTDSFGSVWSRDGADRSPDPTTPSPSDWEVHNTPGIMWPQSNLEEVQKAQELAEAGDPNYTWQLEPDMESILIDEGPVHTPEILARFVRKEFGWEEFALIGGSSDLFEYGGFQVVGAQLVRCDLGKKNPLWPGDPRLGECAPTIDALLYEMVEIFVTQPGKQGQAGIWVASFGLEVNPMSQIVPITDVEIAAIMEAFLQARIAGEGAEQYLGPPNSSHVQIPFLYATSTGAPYERGEFEIEAGEIDDQGPLGGAIGLLVRLFADGGQTVVEQILELESRDGGWVIYQHEGDQNTENGVLLPRP